MTPVRQGSLPVTLRVASSVPAVIVAGLAGYVVGPAWAAALPGLAALCWYAALAPWRHDRGTKFSWGRIDGPQLPR